MLLGRLSGAWRTYTSKKAKMTEMDKATKSKMASERYCLYLNSCFCSFNSTIVMYVASTICARELVNSNKKRNEEKGERNYNQQ